MNDIRFDDRGKGGALPGSGSLTSAWRTGYLWSLGGGGREAWSSRPYLPPYTSPATHSGLSVCLSVLMETHLYA